MRRHELTDFEWRIIEPLLSNKPRRVSRVNDRRTLNGILWRFRNDSPWRYMPEWQRPSTTCYNRLNHWREAGRILDTVSATYDDDLIMIESSARVHQHGATGKNGMEMVAWDVPAAAAPAIPDRPSHGLTTSGLCQLLTSKLDGSPSPRLQ